MATDDRMERYVAAATAGLKPDRELQLDVQAELRAHLEDRLKDEATAAGPTAGGGDAVDRALAALGPVTEVAGGLAAANRRRMTVRARGRLLLRWLLVPAAVVAAFFAVDLGPLTVLAQFNTFGGDGYSVFPGITALANFNWLPGNWFKPRFTPEQQLILHGDLSRPTKALQQRAIWEKHPASKVYYGNYLTYAMTTVDETHATPELMAALEADLDQGRKLEPDNARFDYILAGKLLRQAAEIKTPSTGKDKDGRSIDGLTWKVTDQAKLDRAMALLKDGLAKPELRRYSREMLLERLTIMGPPDSMLSNLEQIAVAAGVLLPDLSFCRQLARASVLYSEQLIAAGRTAEAVPFLNAWQTLAVQLNGDSFTLIDVLVEGAIASIGETRIPDLWLKAGQPQRAEIARQHAELLVKPVRDWRAKNKLAQNDPAWREQEQRLKKSGSILANLLLPAFGEWPAETALAPSRLMEYVLAEKMALALLALLLLAGMLGCGMIYLRWRVVAGGAAIPLLLLPTGRETLRILGYGIVLPVLGYYVYSRWLPFSGREYNLAVAWPRLVAESVILLLLILGVTSHLAVSAVRRRCGTLGVEMPPSRRFGLVKSLFGPRRFGLYYGSTARTLIPFLAMGVILLSLLAKPYLNLNERKLLRSDSLLRIDNAAGGFTSVESQVTHRLTTEIRQAAANLTRQ